MFDGIVLPCLFRLELVYHFPSNSGRVHVLVKTSTLVTQISQNG